MFARLARFAKDSYFLSRTPHSTRRKTELWLKLIHPSPRMLGFEVSAFDQETLAYLYREIFARQNYYFPASTDEPVILDCGANLGMATVYFKWLYPKSRIKAFEPDPSTFTLLQKNVERNKLHNVSAYNCALWDSDGSVEFFLDPKSQGSLLMSTDRSRASGQGIQVPSRKLSDFIEGEVDFVKLDVEGAEGRVLQDLIKSGKIALIKQMVIEYHHHIGDHHSCLSEFLSALETAGFGYQMNATLYPVTTKGAYQDILIGAYRR